MEMILCLKKYADAKRNVRDAVLISEDRLARQVASRVHNMNFFPKEAWKAIKTLRNR